MTRSKFLIVLAIAVTTDALAIPSRAGSGPPRSIQETMTQIIDPTADGIWDAFAFVESTECASQRAPRTNAEWRKVIDNARRLAAGARNLQRPDLIVTARANVDVADAEVPGTRTAKDIQGDIAAAPDKFRRFAVRLQTQAQAVLRAAQSHDAARVIAIGGEIDAACEACHAAYWYPRTLPQTLPSFEAFGEQTNGQ
jgi:hypothetical protein